MGGNISFFPCTVLTMLKTIKPFSSERLNQILKETPCGKTTEGSLNRQHPHISGVLCTRQKGNLMHLIDPTCLVSKEPELRDGMYLSFKMDWVKTGSQNLILFVCYQLFIPCLAANLKSLSLRSSQSIGMAWRVDIKSEKNNDFFGPADWIWTGPSSWEGRDELATKPR